MAPRAKVGALLERTAQALDSARWTDALSLACEAWRVTRDDALAALIERLTTLIEPTLESLKPGNRAAMQKEWMAVEARRRPEDLPRLLRALQQTHWRSTQARVRAARLRDWPADPRVPALLVEQLLAPSFHASSSRPFWNAVFDLFLAHPSRQAPSLLADCQRKLSRAFPGHAERAMRTWLQRRAGETLQALEPLCVPPAPVAGINDAVSRLTALLEAALQREARLLGDVYARPSDDSARAVCADALQERGDLHGELIALQLRSTADEPARRRIGELLAAHGEQWLGPLRAVVEPSLCTFHRGFLDFAFVSGAPVEALEAPLNEPAWSTVRAIQLERWHEVVPRLLRAPVMRSLEHLSTDSLALFSERAPVPLRSLTLDVTLDSRAMANTRALPHLEELGIRGDDLDALFDLPWAKRLRAVTLSADAHAHPPLAEWLQRLRKLPKLETIRFVESDAEWRVTAERSNFLVEATRSWSPNLMKCMQRVLESAGNATRVEWRVSPSPQASLVKAVAALNTSGITAVAGPGVLSPLGTGLTSSEARWGASRSH